MLVSRASQTQKVPHIGCPQRAPVTRARKVNAAPIGAAALAVRSATGCFQISPTAEETAMMVYIIRAIQAAGT